MLPMKSTISRLAAVFLCLSIGTGAVMAGPFHTKVIIDQPLVLSIAENVFLQIRNFTQDGSGATRGTVTATIDGQTVNVLTASQTNNTDLASPPEFINRIVVAGPATITVNPIANAKLTISYRKLREGAPVTPTPAPTAVPTATPTATPTPTP